METSVQECIARDEQRAKKVGEGVIRRMHRQFLKQAAYMPSRIKALPRAILCDLDGTLALLNGRNPFDASTCDADLLNEPVANVLRNYKQLGFTIILLSGREDRYKPQPCNSWSSMVSYTTGC